MDTKVLKAVRIKGGDDAGADVAVTNLPSCAAAEKYHLPSL